MNALTDQQKEDLAEVIGAAESWADELVGDVAAGAEENGDYESAESYRDSAASIQRAASRLSLSVNPTTCEWFATCTNPAVIHIHHPILGAVPACQRCADKLDRLS